MSTTEQTHPSGCPALEHNSYLIGPALSHTRAMDELREEHASFWNTHEIGYWCFTRMENVREGLQRLWIPAANRDPRVFPNPDTVDLERSPNPHIAFGAGPHRCLGSHLARRELRVAFEEWHARIPEYRLDSDVDVLEHGGMFGLDSLALRWD